VFDVAICWFESVDDWSFGELLLVDESELPPASWSVGEELSELPLALPSPPPVSWLAAGRISFEVSWLFAGDESVAAP